MKVHFNITRRKVMKSFNDVNLKNPIYLLIIKTLDTKKWISLLVLPRMEL